jgi:cytochrome c biogenesis protein CcmG/thiol:disulfide interchange protein DsbE
MTKRRTLSLLSLTALLALPALAGCGGSSGGDYGGSHPDYAKALAGSPAPLAKLHSEGNELIDGGSEPYEARIAALKGYPIVANAWASWCNPCREEFPILQQTAANLGKRVAFLGINSQDSDDAASTYLKEAPVPYPSYTDPDAKIFDALGPTRGLPDTAIYNRAGELTYLKQGPYTSEAQLEEDIRHYGLESG